MFTCPQKNPYLEEIRTEVIESGQKRKIKTPGVNGNVSPLSTIPVV